MYETLDDLPWSPELIGYTVSVFMYGITLGQSVCYAFWFPKDPWHLKLLVFLVFLADTVHVIGSTHFIWTVLISCHQMYTWSCRHEMMWGGYIVAWLNYNICCTVQGFYCYRIWTISDNNKFLTLAIFLTAFSEYILATLYNIEVNRARTIDYTFRAPLILPFACLSTICDTLITGAIFKYMWKSGFRRQRSIIQDLAVVCINTGAFTCTVSVIIGIMYLAQGSNYWMAGAGFVVGRSYVNSMLAVLNARKKIRDRNLDINISALTPIPRTR